MSLGRNQKTGANNFISSSQQSYEGRIISPAFLMKNESSKMLSHSLKTYSKKTGTTQSQRVVEAVNWQNSFRRKFGNMH